MFIEAHKILNIFISKSYKDGFWRYEELLLSCGYTSTTTIYSAYGFNCNAIYVDFDQITVYNKIIIQLRAKTHMGDEVL